MCVSGFNVSHASLAKRTAPIKFGFHLYFGGIPGNLSENPARETFLNLVAGLIRRFPPANSH